MLCCVWGYFMMIINNENKYIRWRNKKKFSSHFHFASSSFASYTDFPPFLSFLIIKKQKKMNIRKNFIHFEHIMKIISSFFASFSFPPCAPFTSSDHLHWTHQSLIWCHRLVLILSAAGSMLPFLLLLVLLLMCVHSYTVYAPICTNDVLYQGEFLFYFIFSNPINVEQKKL